MLPVPKDENYTIKPYDWSAEPSADYNEAESDAELAASNPAAFDYSEFDDNDETQPKRRITGTVTPI